MFLSCLHHLRIPSVGNNITPSLHLSQVAGNLLRESGECDVLAEQILNTVFSRYVGANDISNASDASEVSFVYVKVYERER